MKIKNPRKLWLIMTVIGLAGIAATLPSQNLIGMMITTLWTVIFGSLYFKEVYGKK